MPQDYNFRSYAIRRIGDGFREAKSLPAADAAQRIDVAAKELEQLRRMTIVNALFSSSKSVMESLGRA